MSIHWTAFLSALSITAFTLLGCWIFTHLAGNRSKDRFLSTLVAIGSGYMLGVAFLELLPLAYQAGIGPNAIDPEQAGLIIVLGILAVIVANQAILGSAQHAHHHVGEEAEHLHSDENCHHDENHPHTIVTAPSGGIIRVKAAKSALLCLSICSFFDGITVSSGHLSGGNTGFIILIGQFFHLMPEGIMAAGFSLASGASKKRALKAGFTIGGVFMTGALVPLLFGGSLAVFLPLSAGIVTYVTLSQLLPEATERRSGVMGILGGVLLYGIIHSVLHTHG